MTYNYFVKCHIAKYNKPPVLRQPRAHGQSGLKRRVVPKNTVVAKQDTASTDCTKQGGGCCNCGDCRCKHDCNCGDCYCNWEDGYNLGDCRCKYGDCYYCDNSVCECCNLVCDVKWDRFGEGFQFYNIHWRHRRH